MDNVWSGAGIGALVVKLRKEKGLSEKALAKKSGVTDAYINLIENNKRTPSLGTLSKIASALDIALNDFFYSVDFQLLLNHKSSPTLKRTIPLYEMQYFDRFSAESRRTVSVNLGVLRGNLAAVQLIDDAMAPLFLPEDMVIIDPQYKCSTEPRSGSVNLFNKIVSGDHVVCDVTKQRFAHYAPGSILRRIELDHDGKHIKLHALNAAYDSLFLNVRSDFYNEHNMDVLNVLGKVIGKVDYRAVSLLG